MSSLCSETVDLQSCNKEIEDMLVALHKFEEAYPLLMVRFFKNDFRKLFVIGLVNSLMFNHAG